jgi:hypothetical protein
MKRSAEFRTSVLVIGGSATDGVSAAASAIAARKSLKLRMMRTGLMLAGCGTLSALRGLDLGHRSQPDSFG